MKLKFLLIFFLYSCALTSHKILIVGENGEGGFRVFCDTGKPHRCHQRSSELCASFGSYEIVKKLKPTTIRGHDNGSHAKLTMDVRCKSGQSTLKKTFNEDLSKEADVVYMKNGDVYKGKIIKRKINEYIQIRFIHGNEKRLQFSKIKEINRE